MRRDVSGFHASDIAGDLMTSEIRSVGFLRLAVPLAGEDAVAPSGFEAEAHAADAGEEVDEGETRHGSIMTRGRDGT